MASLYSNEFISYCIDKYDNQKIVKVEQESNFQLAFTSNRVYDLDQIILLRRRDVGNAPANVHVIDRKEDENYADIAMVLLAVGVVLNRPELWEQESLNAPGGPEDGGNGNVAYDTYSTIKEVPNYLGRVKEILDKDSAINQERNIDGRNILDRLYEDIPYELREKDGLIQINTQGNKTFFDILDIEDPDDVL